jgi:hypothetical protein
MRGPATARTAVCEQWISTEKNIVNIEETQTYPAYQKQSRIPIVIASIAAVLAIAGIAFGFIQSANSSQARNQNTHLSQQISQLQAQESRIQSQLLTAESTAKNAQSAATNANLARLGICWSASYQSNNGISWIDSMTVDQAVSTNGVYTCPQGDTFVSVVPQPSTAGH